MMSVLYDKIEEKYIFIVSILGACAHNIGNNYSNIYNKDFSNYNVFTMVIIISNDYRFIYWFMYTILT